MKPATELARMSVVPLDCADIARVQPVLESTIPRNVADRHRLTPSSARAFLTAKSIAMMGLSSRGDGVSLT